jgi:hypothetical protein
MGTGTWGKRSDLTWKEQRKGNKALGEEHKGGVETLRKELRDAIPGWEDM